MGDAAEMMIEGFLCEQCGVLVDGEWPGYSRRCRDCKGEVK